MIKNAYLIVAHKNWEQLKRLIASIDFETNDIFIHINSLVLFTDEIKKMLEESAVLSKVYFCERIEIKYGGSGLLLSCFPLLEEAKKRGKYDYYHFLSGQDLPIKSNKYINEFLIRNEFNNNSNGRYKTNYIDARLEKRWKMKAHVCQYMFFVSMWTSNNKMLRFLSRAFNRCILFFQLAMNINRLNDFENIYYGSPWWSITDAFASFILDNKDAITSTFEKHTFAADEYAIQTLFANSEFSDSVYIPNSAFISPNLREIDFSRHENMFSPNIMRMCDYEKLVKSNNLISRKFDNSIDSEIIDKILESRNKIIF